MTKEKFVQIQELISTGDKTVPYLLGYIVANRQGKAINEKETNKLIKQLDNYAKQITKGGKAWQIAKCV